MTVKRLIALFALLIIMATPVYAGELYDEQYRASGAESLPDELPDETLEYLDKIGVSDPQSDNISTIDFKKLAETVGDLAGESARKPLAVSGSLLAVTVVCALLEGAKSAVGEKSIAATASAAATLSSCMIAAAPIASFIGEAADAILTGCGFASAFVPVFAAILSAGGQTLTAAGYSGFMLAVLEGCTAVIASVLIPLVKIFMAVAIVSSVMPAFRLDGIVTLIEKNLKWVLGFFAALLAGALSVSTIASASADNAATRAVKYVVSGAVPVVGGAISDAVLSVQSCVGILRASVGGFGILAMAFIFLPPIISCAVWQLSVSLCSAASDMLGTAPVSRLLKSLSSVLSVMLSMLVFTAFILIIASAVTLAQRSV